MNEVSIWKAGWYRPLHGSLRNQMDFYLGAIMMATRPTKNDLASIGLYIAKQGAAIAYVFCAILIVSYAFMLMDGNINDLHRQLNDVIISAVVLMITGSFLLLKLHSELQNASKAIALQCENIDNLLQMNSATPDTVSSKIFIDAMELARQRGYITTAILQKTFNIGYIRALDLLELLGDVKVVEKRNDEKPRRYIGVYK